MHNDAVSVLVRLARAAAALLFAAFAVAADTSDSSWDCGTAARCFKRARSRADSARASATHDFISRGSSSALDPSLSLSQVQARWAQTCKGR